ncbi:phage tail protein [Pseudomonas piscis]|uniref:Phage tail protein n=1 Tax=Pseudomonas piscis TaxID=2614538 RepID=A0A7X1PJ93_9PSED|nr:phage tail protein [Pseudomonas piscis]MQA52628.1 hypothetical protein [Pseudomonas piscis]
MKQQMALGDFIFGLSRSFAYDSLVRTTDGGWKPLNILVSKPRTNQGGQALETLKITGKAMYGVAMARLDELRALQARRVPLPLIDGVGRNWGRWVIKSVTETQSSVIDDGTAMLIDWVLDLEEFANA